MAGKTGHALGSTHISWAPSGSRGLVPRMVNWVPLLPSIYPPRRALLRTGRKATSWKPHSLCCLLSHSVIGRKKSRNSREKVEKMKSYAPCDWSDGSGFGNSLLRHPG